MSLPNLSTQAPLFATLTPEFFAPEERYVASKLDYRTEAAALKEKMNQAGANALTLLQWVAQLSDASVAQGRQMQLLQRVFDEDFQCEGPGAPAQKEVQPTGAVHNPHEPQAQWAAKGQGKHKKEHAGYKVQLAESGKVSYRFEWSYHCKNCPLTPRRTRWRSSAHPDSLGLPPWLWPPRCPARFRGGTGPAPGWRCRPRRRGRRPLPPWLQSIRRSIFSINTPSRWRTKVRP